MPIVKRTRTPPKPAEEPLDAASIVQTAVSCVNVISHISGERTSVVVVLRTDGKTNIVTNTTDYEDLTKDLQSIVNLRKRTQTHGSS